MYCLSGVDVQEDILQVAVSEAASSSAVFEASVATGLPYYVADHRHHRTRVREVEPAGQPGRRFRERLKEVLVEDRRVPSPKLEGASHSCNDTALCKHMGLEELGSNL